MKTDRQLIPNLTQSGMFRNFERAFAEATGMPLTLRPVQTWQLPFHSNIHENSFCAVIAEKSRTCAACLQLQEQLTQDAMDNPATRTCAYGLCETAVPVKLGAQTIGFLQTGQVMRRNPTEASFQLAVQQAATRDVDINNEQARQAYFKTPVASKKKLDAASGLLAIFADHLAMKTNQILLQTANAEPPIITKAKQFIAEHYTEQLSLSRVSSVVSASRFYFCKQFRNATGQRFTEFVSRIRIEKAKTLLLNPHTRISEIAFAVGFQSLGNFARMFLRIEGRSPSEYRDKLPAARCVSAGITRPTPVHKTAC